MVFFFSLFFFLFFRLPFNSGHGKQQRPELKGGWGAYLYRNMVRVSVEGRKAGSELIQRLDVYNGLVNSSILDSNELKSITGIAQQPSNNEWLLSFEKSFNVQQLFNKVFTIRNWTARICDPNVDESSLSTLRLIWLPPGFDLTHVRGFLISQKGIREKDIISISHEKCRDEGLKHLVSGIIRVRLSNQSRSSTESFLGFNRIRGLKTYIMRVSDQMLLLSQAWSSK